MLEKATRCEKGALLNRLSENAESADSTNADNGILAELLRIDMQLVPTTLHLYFMFHQPGSEQSSSNYRTRQTSATATSVEQLSI